MGCALSQFRPAETPLIPTSIHSLLSSFIYSQLLTFLSFTDHGSELSPLRLGWGWGHKETVCPYMDAKSYRGGGQGGLPGGEGRWAGPQEG